MVSYRVTKDPETPVSVLKELGTIDGEVLYQCFSWHQKSSAFLNFQQTHIGIFVLGCPPSPRRTSCVRARRHCLDLSKGKTPWSGYLSHPVTLAPGSGYYPVGFSCLIQRNCGSKDGQRWPLGPAATEVPGLSWLTLLQRCESWRSPHQVSVTT